MTNSVKKRFLDAAVQVVGMVVVGLALWYGVVNERLSLIELTSTNNREKIIDVKRDLTSDIAEIKSDIRAILTALRGG